MADIEWWLAADAADKSAWVWKVQDDLLAHLWKIVLAAKAYETEPDTADHFLRCDLEDLYHKLADAFDVGSQEIALARTVDFLERIPDPMKADMRRGSAR